MARTRSTIAALVAAVLCVAPAVASPSDPSGRAAAYLASRQLASGAFGAPDQPADATIEEAASIAAAGGAANVITRALDYTGAHGPARARARAGTAGRIVLGLVTTGADPVRFKGFDYVAQISSFYDPVTGRYDTGMYGDALAILGVVAARRSVPSHALTYLRANQCPGGGFAHDSCVQGADVDTSALVLNALVRAGAAMSDGAVVQALGYLDAARNDDGGWGAASNDGHTNANSTALALSALAAAGRALPGDATRALLSLQLPSGAFRFRADLSTANDYATIQAIPGVLGMGYPLQAGVLRGADAKAGPRLTATGVPRDAANERTPATTNGECAPGAHHATLTVVFGDARTRNFCVAFRERVITGFELLRRSGLPLVYQDAGGGAVFICAIGGEGRAYPSESCVPPCPSSGACTFWGYYTFDDPTHAWTFSDLGAASREVHDGDRDGWRFGAQGTSGGCPPDTTLRASCAAPIVRTATHTSAPASHGRAIVVFALLLISMTAWALAIARARRSRELP